MCKILSVRVAPRYSHVPKIDRGSLYKVIPSSFLARTVYLGTASHNKPRVALTVISSLQNLSHQGYECSATHNSENTLSKERKA